MNIKNLKRAEELSRELDTLKNCRDLLCLRETAIIVCESETTPDLENVITDDWIKGILARVIYERMEEIKAEVEEL